MEINNQEYGKQVNAKSKPSPLGRDMLCAFLVGGAICVLGQALLSLYKSRGLSQDDASGAVSITLVLAAVRWSPFPALPTPWSPRLWSTKARA